jgi:hypothetical protein
VVKTVLSDNNNDDNNVQTFTFSSTEEGAATQEGTDVQEDVNGLTRDLLLSEEVSSTAGQLPPQQGSIARDQPISIGQAFPGLWETRAVNHETPRQSQATATSSVGSSGRQSQTIEFDDREMRPRPSRQSSASIQEMIDHSRRQSTAMFNSPPAVLTDVCCRPECRLAR